MRGNAIVLVLVAVALLGLLTLAVTRGTSEAPDAARHMAAEIGKQGVAQRIAAVKAALERMAIVNGPLAGRLSLVAPGEEGFDTPPHALKLYHPQGGGVAFDPAIGVDPQTLDVIAKP